MKPPSGAPMPGGRPDDGRSGARARRSRPYALDGVRPTAESTRRLLAERRALTTRDGGRDGAGRGGGSGGGRPRRPRRGGPGDPGRERVYRRRRIAALGVAAALLLGLWFLTSLFQPFKGEGEGSVQVEIPNGSGVGQIGDLLADEGVISSPFFFELRARLAGSAEDLKSGTFTLREDMSYGAALAALTTGAPATNVVSVTVPEGRSRSEIAPIVEDAGIDGDYMRASEESQLLDPAEYGAEDAESLEGFLFPSTYELKRSADAEDLVKKQLQAFEDEFENVDMSEAEAANLTPYDVLIIASLVERETLIPKERPIVASVIYNRLEQGEPLYIDATTRFEQDNWTEPLTDEDFAEATPYNTRLNAGLPPGPIGNPGRDSIEAAAHPDDTDFLFYVVKPGTCGEHVFTESIEEHEAAVAEYDQARAEAGYRSPTDCPE